MDYTGSIYRLIDRAEDEMKEYAQRVKQLSADEIYRHSAETAAKESLLSALMVRMLFSTIPPRAF